MFQTVRKDTFPSLAVGSVGDGNSGRTPIGSISGTAMLNPTPAQHRRAKWRRRIKWLTTRERCGYRMYAGRPCRRRNHHGGHCYHTFRERFSG